MASIGSLEVSLSLNASNFNGTVAQVNRNMKAMSSELQAIKAKGSAYENSLTGLSQKQNVLSRSFDAASVKLQEQRRRYDELVASGTASAAQIERQANAVNQAQTQYNRLERELAEVTEQLRIQSSQWTQTGQRMQEVGSKLSAVGDGMMNVGKKLSMYVTAPMAAMGVGAFKAAVDFESAFAGVRKTVDATESEFQFFSDEIRNMSKEIPAAATEIAKVAEAAGQLGIKNEAILGFTRTMTDMGVATNMSADEAATALARFSNITKMSQQDFDKLGSTVVDLGNNFATTESEIIDMALRLAGAGAQIGMSEADILGLATALSSVGIQAEMGGSALSRVMVRMQVAATTGLGKMDELTQKTGMSLRELQMLAANNSMDFTSLADSLGMTNKEMKNIVNAGVDLENFAKVAGMTSKQFKEMFEKDAVGAIGAFVNGLGNAEQAGESAINMLQEMGITEILLRDSLLRAGNANELFASSIDIANKAWEENVALTNEAEQRYKTTESQLIILKNKLVDLGITLGNILIPFVLKVVELIEPWIEGFANLSEKTQKTILVIGGLAAAIGPVLIVGGALISSIGTIISAVGGLSIAIGAAGGATTAFGAALALVTGPVGLAVGGIAALTAGGVALYKNWDTIVEKNPQLLATFAAIAPPVVLAVGAIKTMQEAMSPAIEKVDLFGEGVSKATQKALGGYLELSDGVSQTLSEVYLTSTRMTEEIAAGMTEKYAEMNKKIVEGMKARHQEELSEMENFFANSSALSSVEEEKILANRQARNDKEVEQQNFMFQRIKEITEKAAAENRQLTEREHEIINNYNQMMKENAVRTFSESELEQKVILERMKENASKVSAEQAAEVVKNAVKQKEEVIKEANDTYDQKYKLIIKMRDETGDISAEEADKMIAEAKKSRDQTIKLAEERHEKIISEAQKQADEHVGKVNWETGEIVSKWDMMKSAVGRKAREIVDDTKNKWEEAKKVTAEKWEAIKSWPGKKIDEMKSAVSTKMGEVKTTIQTKWNEAESFLKNVNLLQVGKDIINGLVKGIGSMAESVWKKVEGIADGITSTAKKILGIKSPSRVFRQIGLWTGEGMAIGLDESSPRVNKAMSNIGDGILAVSKNYQKEYTNLIDEFNRKNEDKNDKTLEKIYKIQNKAAKKKRDLTQKELQDIALLQASYRDNKLKADQDFNKKYKALVEKSEKEYLEVIKSYIADKKSLEELTLIDEAKVWEQSMELFAEGTAERIKAQQEYKKAVEAVNKEITAINNDYSNQILKINEDLAKQEETLTKAYTDAVDKRAQSLVSFKSLFDEFKVEIDVTGGELLANLKSQVDGFILWQKEIEKLSERAIDQGLLAELREMGPKALGELKALNGLTDDQLKQYSELYKEKSALARKQAETELIGMKNDTDKQITNLRRAASVQLDTLNTEWQQKIKALTQTTSSELSSLEQIGKDAGQGLLNGLGSMQGPLEKKAREIADSITKTMKSALDIHSPSRVMKQIGIWTVEGLALGIEDSSNMVLSASQNVVKKVAQTFEELPDLIDGYEKRYFKDSQSIMDKFLEIYTTKDAYGVEALKFLKTALEMEHLSYYDRLAILKEYENQKELASYRLVQMEKDYSKKVIEIEEERTRKQSELLAQYEAEVTKRTKEIYKQFGLLDKIELKSITGDEMITSLDSQIIAMETYTASIEKLVARGIGGKLLEEISALGPKAAGQVASFADMTEEELNKYVELWTRKNELAKETAVSQLTSMKEDIDKQMIEINEDAEKQLAKYKDEYEFMFKELNGVASNEMDVLQNNLNTDGRNAMQGLIDGMESMKDSVMATAQSIASAVSSTIQSALDIHSPSRVMRGFGVNIGQGLVLGMDDMLSKVTEASKRLASSVEDNTSFAQGTQSNIDNSKHFKPSVVIHTNDSGAREMERTLRRMQFGF